MILPRRSGTLASWKNRHTSPTLKIVSRYWNLVYTFFDRFALEVAAAEERTEAAYSDFGLSGSVVPAEAAVFLLFIMTASGVS